MMSTTALLFTVATFIAEGSCEALIIGCFEVSNHGGADTHPTTKIQSDLCNNLIFWVNTKGNGKVIFFSHIAVMQCMIVVPILLVLKKPDDYFNLFRKDSESCRYSIFQEERLIDPRRKSIRPVIKSA